MLQVIYLCSWIKRNRLTVRNGRGLGGHAVLEEAIAMRRILVFDGDKARRQGLRDTLRFYGYAVIESAECREALYFAQKLKPHLICLDMADQAKDGYQTLTLLKTDPLTRAIPIIGITSCDKKGSHDLIKHAGFDDCIYHPLDPRHPPEVLWRLVTPVEESESDGSRPTGSGPKTSNGSDGVLMHPESAECR
jgi:two-component system cell cycle response regulator DivK